MTKKTIIASCWIVFLFVGSWVVDFYYYDFAYSTNVDEMLLTPRAGHLLGTDSLGRDLFARLLGGAKISLAVGFLGTSIAFVVGATWGSFCGAVGGRLDRLGMRLVDIFTAVPSFILVAVFVLTLQESMPNQGDFWSQLLGLTLGIGLTRWMTIARVTRGLVQGAKQKPFIEAARVMGGSEWRVLWKHIRPNIIDPLAVLFVLQMPTNLLYESFMSFIGIGVQAPKTSWGLLIQDGWRSLSTYPHLVLAPSAVVFLTVYALNILVVTKSRTRL